MRILVWGAYQQGNFGDDMMAWIFSRSFGRSGHETKVFGLSQCEAEDLSIATVRDIDQAVAWADAVVIGGGAVFDRWWRRRDFVQLLRSAQVRNMELQYHRLGRALKRHGKPLHMASVGSNGISHLAQMSPFRYGLMRAAKDGVILLRLKSDLRFFLNHRGVVAQFPDILFATPTLLGDASPKNRCGDEPKRVLLNLYRGYAQMVPLIVERVRAKWPDAIISSTQSHLPEIALDYEWTPAPGAGVTEVPYSGVRSMLSLLAETDIVISSKLHIGIVGMSLGANFISLGGSDKVRVALGELGIDDTAYLSPGDFTEIAIDLALENNCKGRAEIHERLRGVAKAAPSHVARVLEVL